MHSSSGADVIELAQMAGLTLDPWQQRVLMGSMGEKKDGKWSAFEVGIVIPRQNGKNSILEARELAGLFLFGEKLILHSAHEFKSAQEAFLRILQLIENTPDFDRRVKTVRRSHGEEGVELKTGQRLRFVARSQKSGRGFSADCIVMDEAMILGSEAMGALLPTLSARPNPQVWYTSSAGTLESTQLARVVRRGREGGDPSLAYFEWCADTALPETGDLNEWAAKPENWAKANPALGIRISAEHVARELAAMDFTEFARERLGIGTYPSEEGSEWEVIEEVLWNTTTDERSEMLDPVAFAIDVSPDRKFATIAAAGARADGLRHVEIVDHAPGTGWVVNRIAGLKERWGPKAIALDSGGPAGSLIPAFDRAGIDIVKFGVRDVAQACGAFYDAFCSLPSTARHQGQEELTNAVRGARKRTLGEAWAWSRRDASVNLSPLMAATLALQAHGMNIETEDDMQVWAFD